MIDCSKVTPNCYNEDLLDKYIPQICNNEYMFFLKKSNVVGVGFGFKSVNNIYTKEKCIAVFVEKKVSEHLLASYEVIPKLYKGIKTDVVETGIFTTFALDQEVRPVTGGYSISNTNDEIRSTGSLGCLVTDGKDIYILSNCHVLSLYNVMPVGTFIMQPSIMDSGDPKTDLIAILSKYIPLKFISGEVMPENFVDCGIAKVINKNFVSSDITFTGTPEGITIPRLNLGVKKVGRTTELTSGVILYTNATKTFVTPFGRMLFKDIIVATPKATYGDSGCILLDANNYVVGLLTGGTEVVYSAYCPIASVLKALNVRMVTT